MPNDEFRYAVELFKEDGASLGRAPLLPDWAPVREWAWFDALRVGRRVLDTTVDAGRVGPVWHETLGEPYVSGFRIDLRDEQGDEHVARITSAYFSRQAGLLSLQLQERGILQAGDKYVYAVIAFPGTVSDEETPPSSLAVRSTAPALAVNDAVLETYRERATSQGEAIDGDFPVFVPAGVLDEMRAKTASAGDVETGGMLIGHVRRDPVDGDAFVEVTAQVPARGVVAESTSLTFTPETWRHTRASIDLRGRGEMMVGWWHSHPVKTWCRDCPPEKRRACPLLVDYFSDQDRLLHRTVFPAAYSVALVVNELAADTRTLSMFGWREGVLHQRGFHVLDEPVGAVAPATTREEESR